MKDEWSPPAKMKHMKQNENNDHGANIISFSQKYYMCSWVSKFYLLPKKKKKSELWYAGVL